jgi:D-aminoacyl-tRNA deacylase
MKLILQRVSSASVTVDGSIIARISQGLFVLFGAEKGDSFDKLEYLAEKTLNLRVFSDEAGKMNLSCLDISGELLIVSQFTLAGDCTKGRRPGFDNAAPVKEAESLYKEFIQKVSQSGLSVMTGQFSADMKVKLVNDGPVTFILER